MPSWWHEIFLTGGTGVVGRPLLLLLVSAGHEVVVVVRSDAGAATVSQARAAAVRLPAYDAPALTAAMAGCDVAVDLTTHVPPFSKAARRSAWAEHDRLRDQGTAAVVAAATAAGVGRVVRDSVVFLHADGGTAWIDEDWPLVPGATLASAVAAEEHVAGFAGEGVVLRFGLLYGPESSYTLDAVTMIRRFRVSPLLGPPEAYLAQLHTSDAAAAVVAALTVAPGTYDVVDDVPLTRAEMRAVQASVLGRRVRALPGFVSKSASAETQTRSLRVSHARFTAASGWTPAYPSAREGWAALPL